MFTVAKEILENYNFSLPVEIAEEFRRIGDVHGERNKLRWAVASAAVLRLLEMPEDEMHKLIRAVAGARHYPDALREMIAAVKGQAAKENPAGTLARNSGAPATGKGQTAKPMRKTRTIIQP